GPRWRAAPAPPQGTARPGVATGPRRPSSSSVRLPPRARAQPWFRICVISSLAFFVASATEDWPVKMAVSMLGMVPAFSTLAQFGAVGTNHELAAALAKGARSGFASSSGSSDVVLGRTPALLTIAVMLVLPTYSLIHSAARSCCLLLAVT